MTENPEADSSSTPGPAVASTPHSPVPLTPPPMSPTRPPQTPNGTNSNNNKGSNSMSMSTIRNSSPRGGGGATRPRKYSDELPRPVRKNSDEYPMNIPPVHPFLPFSSYDSDGSNGSFVQQRRRGSLDSSGSSGGGIKYTTSNTSSGPPTPRQQQAQQPLNPALLPYHERRKLLQQRQKQQQQQQQQQQQRQQQSRLQSQRPIDPRYSTLHDLTASPHGQPSAYQYQSHPPHQLHPSFYGSNGNGGGGQQRFQQPPPLPHGLPAFDSTPSSAYMNMYGVSPPTGGYYYLPPPPSSGPTSSGGYPTKSQTSSSTPSLPYRGGGGYPQSGFLPTATASRPPPTENTRLQSSFGHPPYGLPARPGPFRGDGSGNGTGSQSTTAKPPKGSMTTTTTPTTGSSGTTSPGYTTRSPRQNHQYYQYHSQSLPPLPLLMPRLPPSVTSSSLDDSAGSGSRTPPPPPPLPPFSNGGPPPTHYFDSSVHDTPQSHQEQEQQSSDPHRNHHRRHGDDSHGNGSNTNGSSLFGIFAQPWASIQPAITPHAGAYGHNNYSISSGGSSSSNSNSSSTTTSTTSNSSLPRHPSTRGRPRQRQRVDSHDRLPPASLGTQHQRLPSITDDDWTERENRVGNTGVDGGEPSRSGDDNDADDDYDDNEDDDDRRRHHQNQQAEYRYEENLEEDNQERASLLPPPGISTNEQDGARRQYLQLPAGSNPHHRVGSDHRRTSSSSDAMFLVSPAEVEEYNATMRGSSRPNMDTYRATTAATGKTRKKKSSKRKKKKRRSVGPFGDQDHSSEDSTTEYHYRQWIQKKDRLLEKARKKLIAQWKAEAQEEAEWNRRDLAQSNHHDLERLWLGVWKRIHHYLAFMATLIANLPLTIGAIALSMVSLGVVWFKFAEENLDSCEPVHFHSSQCTFPEFPGCFYCDTNSRMYKAALGVHFGCTIISGLLVVLFILKVLLAPRVVVDEMSSPTTASPAGLFCMTAVCVFAGRGTIGQVMVTAAAGIHLCLVLWFAYIAVAYRILPEPSWFPNTVGIGLTAVKMWLYNPVWGYWLMAISLACNFFFFPISLIRVAINHKISATVGWMQMSAPAVSLYSLTIMAQPSFEEEHPDITKFQSLHRAIYLPCMHVMAGLAFVGFVSSCHCLWNRWNDFRTKEFSPAHAAFCFPILSYVNALQAYRGAIISFSEIHPHSWRMDLLYIFWFTVLVGGTIATLWITIQFLYYLPRWTKVDLSGEDEPPLPHQTILVLRDVITTGETMRQPFVSPAILQANETGALILARSGSSDDLRYVRTRRLTALGFEPRMDWVKMEEERNVLLDWVSRNPTSRQRNRTLSVPGVDFQPSGEEFGHGNSGVYGSVNWSGPAVVMSHNNYY